MKRLILSLAILFISKFATSQQTTPVKFEVVSYKNVIKPDATPDFTFRIFNNHADSLAVSKAYRIIHHGDFLSNIDAEILFDGKPAGILTCSVDFYEIYPDEKGKLSVFGAKKIGGHEEYLFTATIYCNDFSRVGEYRIRFSLDSSKTGLTGRTEWITLNVRK
jgi:hypothetical protein